MLRTDFKSAARAAALAIAAVAAGGPIAPCAARPAPAAADDCWHGLGPALKASGFPGYDACGPDRVELRYVGGTPAFRGHSYVVYNEVYWFGGDEGTAVHRGQWLLIFDGKRRYLGGYHVDPLVRVRLRGFDMLLSRDGPHASRVSLKRTTPPQSIPVDDDNYQLQ